MADFLSNLNFALQSIVTWLMTVVLLLLAFVTIFGFLKFIMDRRINKYMFCGFVLFIVCMLIFTKIFGYRMEIFNASINQIMLYALWYWFFYIHGIPAQPPPNSNILICSLIISLPLL